MATSAPALVLVLAVASGCAAGGFGGLGGKKDGGGGKSASSAKEESAGDEGEDAEEAEADAPVEVTGAWLTVACAPTATKPSHMPEGDYKPFGCAVIDTKTKLFYSEAKVSNVIFTFSEGDQEVVPLVEAPTGGPWHVYTYVETAKAEHLKSIRGYASVKEKTVNTVNVDLDIYDPEGLVQVTEDEAQTPGGNGLILSVLATDPSAHSEMAKATVDNAPGTIWNVSGVEEPHHIWVIYDLGGIYQLKEVIYDLCAAAPDSGTITASDEVLHLGLGTMRDAVKIGDVARGERGVRSWVVDAKARPFRFVKFYMEEEGATNSVCLNSVHISGDPVAPAKP